MGVHFRSEKYTRIVQKIKNHKNLLKKSSRKKTYFQEFEEVN